MSKVKITRTFALDMDDIVIHRGEHLLLYLRTDEGDNGGRFHQINVELRVLPDGTPEIWVRPEYIEAGIVHPETWNTYVPMPDTQESVAPMHRTAERKAPPPAIGG
jgi:hypothetical protein